VNNLSPYKFVDLDKEDEILENDELFLGISHLGKGKEVWKKVSRFWIGTKVRNLRGSFRRPIYKKVVG